ncbi:MAG: bacteriophage Gp15 family protein [Lachnospiraceae bacterium]|nr:bacteriophage Gp15 family protein [Lachnospiraceae bacterium]
MIVASFTTQYGLRISDIKNMRWSEFRTLLIGLSPDTVLGRIVTIRAEEDTDTLKSFTADQHRIRNEWRSKHSPKLSTADMNEVLDNFKNIFLAMAGIQMN